MESVVLKRFFRRTFIRKARRELSGIYRFASIYYGPRRMVHQHNLNPATMYQHRAEVHAFLRGAKKALSE